MCGIFLMVVAILGVIGIFKQSQSLMFYYMIFLGIIFVFQFFLSIACLGVTEEREIKLIELAWTQIDDPSGPMEIRLAEQAFNCCGLNETDERRNTTNLDINSEWFNETSFCIHNVTVKNVPVCEVSSDTLDFT